jgi:hypothetical protein
VEVATEVRVGAKGQASDAGESIGPVRRHFCRRTEIAPVVAHRLDVRHLVRFVRRPEPLQPYAAHARVSRRAGNHRDEIDNCVIHRSADGAGRAVDLLECGRETLDQGDRALGGEHGVLPRDLLDLGLRLLDAPDRRLRPPPERVAAESRLEFPLVRPGTYRVAHRGDSSIRKRRSVRQGTSVHGRSRDANAPGALKRGLLELLRNPGGSARRVLSLGREGWPRAGSAGCSRTADHFNADRGTTSRLVGPYWPGREPKRIQPPESAMPSVTTRCTEPPGSITRNG